MGTFPSILHVVLSLLISTDSSLSGSLPTHKGLHTSGIDGLTVTPHAIEFGETQVCVPVVESVTVAWQANDEDDATSEIKFIKVESLDPQFIVPLFTPGTVLQQGESLTLQLVFLPQHQEIAKSIIMVRTSRGAFVVHVIGTGVKNILGITPFVGQVIPEKSMYQPGIWVDNRMGKQDLKVEEMYTTEVFLHMRLGDENWRVPAGTRKKVASLAFQSHVPGMYRGFVRMKTNLAHMLIPVEVEVLAKGVYVKPEEIDFGTRNVDEQTELLQVLSLHNFLSESISIVGMSVRDSHIYEDEEQDIDIAPVMFRGRMKKELVLPGGQSDMDGLVLGFLPVPSKVTMSGRGELIVFTNSSNPTYKHLRIALKYALVSGSLNVEPRGFPIPFGKEAVSVWGEQQKILSLNITNEFAVPAIIHDISLVDDDMLTLQFSPSYVDVFKRVVGRTLAPGETLPGGVDIEYQVNQFENKDWGGFIHQGNRSHLLISTSVMDITVPIELFNGLLYLKNASTMDGEQVVSTETEKGTEFDFGKTLFGSTETVDMLLINHNPIQVDIRALKPHKQASGRFTKMNLIHPDLGELSLPYQLCAGGSVIIRVLVNIPSESVEQGPLQLNDVFDLETSFELRRFSFSVNAIPGTIEVSPIDAVLANAMIDTVGVVAKVRIVSSFKEPFKVTRVSSDDPRIYMPPPVFQGNVETGTGWIGHVSIDMTRCGHDEACLKTLQSCKGRNTGYDPESTMLEKIEHIRRRKDSWKKLVGAHRNRIKTKLRVYTNFFGVMRVVDVRIDNIECIDIIKDQLLRFIDTQVGEVTEGYIPIVNPSKTNTLHIKVEKPASQDAKSPFVIPESLLTKSYNIPPLGTRKIGPILFSPLIFHKGVNSDTIFIKNNVTFLEPVSMEAFAALPQLELLYSKSRDGFDVVEIPVSSLPFSNSAEELNVLTSVLLKNVGDIRIHVQRIEIKDQQFFSLPNSKQFDDIFLAPGETINISVRVEPDCIASILTGTLEAHFGAEYVLPFGVEISFSDAMLETCSQRKHSSFSMLVAVLIGLVSVGVFVFKKQSMGKQTPCGTQHDHEPFPNKVLREEKPLQKEARKAEMHKAKSRVHEKTPPPSKSSPSTPVQDNTDELNQKTTQHAGQQSLQGTLSDKKKQSSEEAKLSTKAKKSKLTKQVLKEPNLSAKAQKGRASEKSQKVKLALDETQKGLEKSQVKAALQETKSSEISQIAKTGTKEESNEMAKETLKVSSMTSKPQKEKPVAPVPNTEMSSTLTVPPGKAPVRPKEAPSQSSKMLPKVKKTAALSQLKKNDTKGTVSKVETGNKQPGKSAERRRTPMKSEKHEQKGVTVAGGKLHSPVSPRSSYFSTPNYGSSNNWRKREVKQPTSSSSTKTRPSITTPGFGPKLPAPIRDGSEMASRTVQQPMKSLFPLRPGPPNSLHRESVPLGFVADPSPAPLPSMFESMNYADAVSPVPSPRHDKDNAANFEPLGTQSYFNAKSTTSFGLPDFSQMGPGPPQQTQDTSGFNSAFPPRGPRKHNPGPPPGMEHTTPFMSSLGDTDEADDEEILLKPPPGLFRALSLDEDDNMTF
mmetsp:Transcript_28718/g.46448  ORF Transcript_28718/g.46448 Transcript_28718/m.46448 type:complete len:1575 (+) Transcript_28718:78-4802(+)|eukprot:CAMPEP_0203764422 /NCGR_PEP_ID=MMETSP0098-20131031/17672_1 /ASSEMBLY_ACC=CAM_ASM_000208 /TAXON_ID=96639 /ORGANISM=" , Strain NY0313808BC1" /LENGTH=1574 /DNA_ID=CAMNT_0050660263 /DNA_START=74 /DNA_END=4798 /DNA_ORIENTATION=+